MVCGGYGLLIPWLWQTSSFYEVIYLSANVMRRSSWEPWFLPSQKLYGWKTVTKCDKVIADDDQERHDENKGILLVLEEGDVARGLRKKAARGRWARVFALQMPMRSPRVNLSVYRLSEPTCSQHIVNRDLQEMKVENGLRKLNNPCGSIHNFTSLLVYHQANK